MLVTNLVFFRKTPFGPTTLTKVWVWFWVLNSFHHLISLKTCKNIWDVFISHLFKNVFAHVSIYCWERVVEEVKVLVGVHSPKTNNQVLYKATSFETPCIWQPSSYVDVTCQWQIHPWRNGIAHHYYRDHLNVRSSASAHHSDSFRSCHWNNKHKTNNKPQSTNRNKQITSEQHILTWPR